MNKLSAIKFDWKSGSFFFQIAAVNNYDLGNDVI